MTFPLAIAFIFYIGAICGWVLEFLFRNLISHSGPRGKFFINPGFCKGPWLPIYGIGLSLMFIICYSVTTKLNVQGIFADIIIILIIMIVMVAIEFIGGLFLLKVLNLRLWDYRDQPGNIMGIVCPLFTLIWGAIGAVYYLFIHDIIIGEVLWLADNLAFSFVVGLFFGFFIIDLVFSSRDAAAIKKYGDNNDVVVKFEELKALIVSKEKELNGKQRSFVDQIKTKGEQFIETLDSTKEAIEDKKIALKSKRNKKK